MVPRYRIGIGEGGSQVFLPDQPRRIHFQRRLSTSVSTQRTTTGVPCSSTRAAWGWKASSRRTKRRAIAAACVGRG
jgi:hypothetical protein